MQLSNSHREGKSKEELLKVDKACFAFQVLFKHQNSESICDNQIAVLSYYLVTTHQTHSLHSLI